jgi:hypothetical protein
VGELGELTAFDDTYYAIAEDLGVRLAPRDDPEKAFGPSQLGIVFGVHYDTATWTWAVLMEGLVRIMTAIHSLLEKDTLPSDELESVTGKIFHVRARALSEGGKSSPYAPASAGSTEVLECDASYLFRQDLYP